MEIGIIVHSQTGNSNFVALKLKEKLSNSGHSVDLEQLEVVEALRQGAKDIQFETLKNNALLFVNNIKIKN